MKGLTGDQIREKYSEETQDLKRKIRNLEQVLRDYKKSHGSIANFFDALKENIPTYAPIKIKYSRPKNVGEKPVVGACGVICDTHYGAVQRANEIEGFGEYSPELCEKRSMDFIARLKNWIKCQRSAYDIPALHLLVLGDLCSGDIHQELQVTNAFPVPVQVMGSARLLASQISTASEWFESVRVHFITEDNHGRLTKKPQAKEAGINSYNYLIGEVSKLMLKDHKNVNFNVYPQLEAVVNVEGRKYLLMHGHGIRGHMGIPYYGMERKTSKEAIRRMNIADKRFDRIVMGHFHHSMIHPNFIVCGSPQGTDAYDHQCGRYGNPSQMSWLVGKHGEFNIVEWSL